MSELTTREQVEAYLQEHPEAGPTEIAEAIGMSTSTVGYHLARIRVDGMRADGDEGEPSPRAPTATRANPPRALVEADDAETPTDDTDDGDDRDDGLVSVGREYLETLELVRDLAAELLRLRRAFQAEA